MVIKSHSPFNAQQKAVARKFCTGKAAHNHDARKCQKDNDAIFGRVASSQTIMSTLLLQPNVMVSPPICLARISDALQAATPLKPVIISPCMSVFVTTLNAPLAFG